MHLLTNQIRPVYFIFFKFNPKEVKLFFTEFLCKICIELQYLSWLKQWKRKNPNLNVWLMLQWNHLNFKKVAKEN